MRAPYGLEIIENCVTCPHREDRLLLQSSAGGCPAAFGDYFGIFLSQRGNALCGRTGRRGVFILCAGRVKLSTSSADGKTLIVRISEPGEVLGLPATVTGKPYELTAEVIEPAQVNFIARTDFLGFLRENGEVWLRVAQQLGETYHAAIAEMRSIGLSHSAGEKLARFLLDWCADHGDGNAEIRAKLTLTHEEIGQMIGASRETVTRLFADFKKKGLLQIKGSTLIIRDKDGLQTLAGN